MALSGSRGRADGVASIFQFIVLSIVPSILISCALAYVSAVTIAGYYPAARITIGYTAELTTRCSAELNLCPCQQRVRGRPHAAFPSEIGGAVIVALGFNRGDPLIGLAITLVILKITWDSWRTVSTTEPGEALDTHDH